MFAEDVLGAGSSRFGVLIFALGLGVAWGVIIVSVLRDVLATAGDPTPAFGEFPRIGRH